MNNTTFQTSFCLRVGKHKGLEQRQNSVVMLKYNAYFWNLLIAALDPIDSVQQRFRTTCVGSLARFKGTVAIHAVCIVPYNAADPLLAEVEDSSVKLECQSSDSQE